MTEDPSNFHGPAASDPKHIHGTISQLSSPSRIDLSEILAEDEFSRVRGQCDDLAEVLRFQMCFQVLVINSASRFNEFFPILSGQ